MRPILIVEDEPAIADLIEMTLEPLGQPLIKAHTGNEAANLLESTLFDLILLDVMLPGVDGFTLMDYIAPTGTPVIFLTAKATVEDRVRGLRLGAYDYIVKPFAPPELLARVETVLRRVGKSKDRIQIGDVIIDESSMQVTKAGAPVALTKKEFDLLLLFARNQNMALFRESIYERVWEAEYTGDSRTVDLHVQRLRKKLGWQNQLTAVYKVGYRLEVKA